MFGRLEFNPRSSHTKDSKNELNTQDYEVWIKGKVEQSRERSRALSNNAVYELLEREPSGLPRLR